MLDSERRRVATAGKMIFYGAVLIIMTPLFVLDCSADCNRTSGISFQAFSKLHNITTLGLGCSTGKLVNLNGSCYATHCIHINGKDPHDIYLNLQWIHDGEWEDLDQCRNYKFEFALYSNSDITWLLSTENLPQKLSLKIYVTLGSSVIVRSSDIKPLVRYFGVEDPADLNAAKLLSLAIQSLQKGIVSSFQELKPSTSVLSIEQNLAVKDILDAKAEGCTSLTPEYVPQLSVQYFESIPASQCLTESEFSQNFRSVYVLNYLSRLDTDGFDGAQTIDVDIVGDPEKHITEIFVFLLSSSSVRWNVGGIKTSYSRNFTFMTNGDVRVDQLFSSYNVKLLNILSDVSNGTEEMIQKIQTISGTKVKSYVQYDTPVEHAYLKLIDHGKIHAVDPMSKNIATLMKCIEQDCSGMPAFQTLILHKSILDTYNLTKNDIAFGSVRLCKSEMVNDALQVRVTPECQYKSFGQKFVQATLNGVSTKHLFPIERKIRQFNISLSCKIFSNEKFHGSPVRPPGGYQMTLFDDAEMHNEQSGGYAWVKEHIKMLYFKIAPPHHANGLTVSLEKCELFGNGMSPLTLIKNNCPSSNAAKIMGRSRYPEDGEFMLFRVNFEALAFTRYVKYFVNCSVSACHYEETCSKCDPAAPQCFFKSHGACSNAPGSNTMAADRYLIGSVVSIPIDRDDVAAITISTTMQSVAKRNLTQNMETISTMLSNGFQTTNDLSGENTMITEKNPESAERNVSLPVLIGVAVAACVIFVIFVLYFVKLKHDYSGSICHCTKSNGGGNNSLNTNGSAGGGKKIEMKKMNGNSEYRQPFLKNHSMENGTAGFHSQSETDPATRFEGHSNGLANGHAITEVDERTLLT